MNEVGESAGRARLIEQLQDAIQVCRDEDSVFARTYIPEQSTRAAFYEAITAMKLAAEALAGQEEAHQLEPPFEISALELVDVNSAAFLWDCYRRFRAMVPPHKNRVDNLVWMWRSQFDNLTRAKAEEDAQHYPEESLATRILQEQKDLEAHTRDVTDVDRLTQIRDSVLKEHS